MEQGWLGAFGDRLKQSLSKPVERLTGDRKVESTTSFTKMVPETYATSLNALGGLTSSVVPTGLMQPLFPAIATAASSFRRFTCIGLEASGAQPCAIDATLAGASRSKPEIHGGFGLPAEVSDSEDGSPTPFRCVKDFAPPGPNLAPLRHADHGAAEVPVQNAAIAQTHYVLVPVPVPVPAMRVHLQPQVAVA
jgi:hypothetical protein